MQRLHWYDRAGNTHSRTITRDELRVACHRISTAGGTIHKVDTISKVG